jgi:hypothetical protein
MEPRCYWQRRRGVIWNTADRHQAEPHLEVCCLLALLEGSLVGARLWAFQVFQACVVHTTAIDAAMGSLCVLALLALHGACTWVLHRFVVLALYIAMLVLSTCLC